MKEQLTIDNLGGRVLVHVHRTLFLLLLALLRGAETPATSILFGLFHLGDIPDQTV